MGYLELCGLLTIDGRIAVETNIAEVLETTVVVGESVAMVKAEERTGGMVERRQKTSSNLTFGSLDSRFQQFNY